MVIGLRRLFIYLFAAAFVLNGVLSHAAIELPAALTTHVHLGVTTASNLTTHYHSASVGQHEESATSGSHNDGVTHYHVDGGSKSSGICANATVPSDLVTTAVPFSYTLISFHSRPHGLTGHLVALDPDIPKDIV
jgi:hypothetical protein